MFKTHETMEMGLMQVFSEDHRYWRMIERDVRAPWFHLTMQFRIDGRFRKRTLMPDDITLLAHLVSQQDDEVQVVDLQVVTPGCLNGRGRWLMEPLAKLELAMTSDDDVVHIYTLADGRTYCDPAQDDQALEQFSASHVIYSRRVQAEAPALQA
ncbi:hypothetical protein B6S59_01390 [Pseudomonas sp. A46]|nr:hypothetical protein [Pseudomonas sp. A46]OWJ98257.1 hypothetical protein B6S59_01390 [Pseudomonas sp. A46]